MRNLQALLLLAFLGTVGIFAAQNTDVITLHFLSWSRSSPVALLVVVVYALGMLTGWTVVAFFRRTLREVSARRVE